MLSRLLQKPYLDEAGGSLGFEGQAGRPDTVTVFNVVMGRCWLLPPRARRAPAGSPDPVPGRGGNCQTEADDDHLPYFPEASFSFRDHRSTARCPSPEHGPPRTLGPRGEHVEPGPWAPVESTWNQDLGPPWRARGTQSPEPAASSQELCVPGAALWGGRGAPCRWEYSAAARFHPISSGQDVLMRKWKVIQAAQFVHLLPPALLCQRPGEELRASETRKEPLLLSEL